MSGILGALAGIGGAGGGGGGGGGTSFTVTVGNYPSITKVTEQYYYGFSSTIGIGAITGTTFSGATVSEMCFDSGIQSLGTYVDGTTSGTTRVIVSGNRSAGFITSLTVGGVSLGTVSAPVYDSGTAKTTFTFTGPNKFGGSGSKTCVMT